MQGGKAVSDIATPESSKGLEVNIGVRPEDLQPVDGEYLYKGKVAYTETLGEVTLLYFSKGNSDTQIIAKLPGVHEQLRDQQVGLSAAPDKIHLFHKGESLR